MQRDLVGLRMAELHSRISTISAVSSSSQRPGIELTFAGRTNNYPSVTKLREQGYDTLVLTWKESIMSPASLASTHARPGGVHRSMHIVRNPSYHHSSTT